jgi:hypothetical protein
MLSPPGPKTLNEPAMVWFPGKRQARGVRQSNSAFTNSPELSIYPSTQLDFRHGTVLS